MIPDELKLLAHDLAQVSAAIIRGYYRSELAIDDKSDASPDKVKQELIQHDVLAEELIRRAR